MTRAVDRRRQVTRLLRDVHEVPPSRWDSDFRILVPTLAIASAIVAGLVLNLAPLTTVGALGAIAVALIAPAVGLATIAFMGPLPPPLVIPAPGFNVILVGAVLLGCVYRLPIDRPRIRLTAPILFLLGFVLFVGVQQTPDMVAGYAGDVGYVVYSLSRELFTGFGLVLAAAYVLRGRSPFPFLALGLASASLSAVLAIYSFAFPEAGPMIAGLTANLNTTRAIGAFGNPNYFGVFEAIATVTAVGWMIGSHSVRLRLPLVVTSIVLAIATVFSMSRGAIIALAAGLVFLAFSRTRARTAGIIAAALFVAAVVLVPVFVEWRLSMAFGSASGMAYTEQAESDAGRLASVLAGPALFVTSPLFGIGWGHYSELSAQFSGPGSSNVAHSWYGSVLAELGTVGIVLWILLLVALLIGLRSRPRFPRLVGLAVLGAYAAGSLFLEAPTSFQASALPILVVVAALTSDWSGPLRAGPPSGPEDVPEPFAR